MRRRFWITAAALAAGSTAAAPPAASRRLVVDRGGVLRLPAPAVRQMGVRPAENGLVCVQFPVSVLRKTQAGRDEHGHPQVVEQRPPKVWTPLRKDGSLALGVTRLLPGPEKVPGPPGTAYLARVEKGVLVLSKPAR